MTLCVGMPLETASRLAPLKQRRMHSHAGAWERCKTFQLFFQIVIPAHSYPSFAGMARSYYVRGVANPLLFRKTRLPQFKFYQ